MSGVMPSASEENSTTFALPPLSSTRISFQPERCAVVITSPDKLLSAIGARNPFLLFVWLAMALVWGVCALPMMVSAFLMDASCTGNEKSGDSNAKEATLSEGCQPKKGTITAEFHLDSAQSFQTDLTTSSYIAGIALGSACMPFVADKYGRRPALLFSLLLSGVMGIASALSPNIYALIGMRFSQGLAFSGCTLVNWVLAYESIPPSLRSRTALVFGLMWVLGYCLIAPMAYFLTNWRHLIAASSAPALLAALVYFFTIPESLHYLVSKRKISDIRKWIEKANDCAERNNYKKVEKGELQLFLQQLESKGMEMKGAVRSTQSEEDKQTPNNNKRLAKVLLKNIDRRLAICLAVSIYLWTCDTFVYYGLSLFSTQLAGDRYLNFTQVALAEVPSYFATPILIEKMGRRLFTAFMHFLAAIAFLTATLSNQPVFFLILWLAAKFSIASSFTGLLVYSSEVFPTIHRNTYMGICAVFSQSIGIFAPTIRLMARLSPAAPMLFFGICSLLASAFTFLLPETRGKELPERVIAGEGSIN